MNHNALKLKSAMMNMPMMLTCREFDGFVTDYFEGNLGPFTTFKFKLHMHLCPPCRSYIEAYRKSIELGKGAFSESDESVPEEVPEALVELVLKSMKKQA